VATVIGRETDCALAPSAPGGEPGDAFRVGVSRGMHARKLKKPSSIDYRTLAARERGGRDELRLNRRLPAIVYGAVISLVTHGWQARAPDACSIRKGDRAEDWLVKKPRWSSARMLDCVLMRGTVTQAELGRLISALTDFSRRAEPILVQAARHVVRSVRIARANRRALKRYGAGLQQPLATELARGVAQVRRTRARLARRAWCACRRRPRRSKYAVAPNAIAS